MPFRRGNAGGGSGAKSVGDSLRKVNAARRKGWRRKVLKGGSALGHALQISASIFFTTVLRIVEDPGSSSTEIIDFTSNNLTKKIQSFLKCHLNFFIYVL